MRRVQSDPTFNRYQQSTEPPPVKVTQPRPLSRRFVVASMIDLAMPRISASIETVVTEAFDAAPKDPEGVRVIRANLEK